ncbi:hypothetical protein PROFUN_04463 [Planoprotostelium fungivorum]|uniref:Uncharacterized protein n=1 Tax=Planoprotostelium fungivorum TaxID=1890364 RepID=A0A2P6NVP4_9EUKA|nr:hypothetical protein PROFUN_04463 [Planoprotostelium fungivorum]
MSLRRLLQEHVNGTEHEEGGEGGEEEERALAGVVVISVIVIFSLILEKAHHKATVYARQTGKKHVGAVIKKVTTELMILGLVSFLFFTVLKTQWFISLLHKISIKEFTDEFIEFLHMFLFVIVAIYVCIVIVLLILGGFIKSQWKRLERRALNRERPRKVGWIFSYFNVAIKYYHFIRLRENFITVHQLPEDFKYYSYLKQIYSQTFSEIVELNWKVWIIVLIVMGLDYADTRLSGTFNVGTGVIFICSLFLWFRVIQMRNHMVEDQSYFLTTTNQTPAGRAMIMTVTEADSVQEYNRSPVLSENNTPVGKAPSLERIPSFHDGDDRNNRHDDRDGERRPLVIQPQSSTFYDLRRSQTPHDAVAIDVHLNFKKTPRWKLCCIPCCATNTQYEAMFPFGRPHSLVYAAQILVFVQSVYISVSIMILSRQISGNVYLMVLNIVLPIINIIFIIGAAVPIICQVLAIHPEYHYAHSENRKLEIYKIKNHV